MVFRQPKKMCRVVLNQVCTVEDRKKSTDKWNQLVKFQKDILKIYPNPQKYNCRFFNLLEMLSCVETEGTNDASLVQSSAVLDSRVYASNCNWTSCRLYHYCGCKQNRNSAVYLHGNLPAEFCELKNPSCPWEVTWPSCELLTVRLYLLINPHSYTILCGWSPTFTDTGW